MEAGTVGRLTGLSGGRGFDLNGMVVEMRWHKGDGLLHGDVREIRLWLRGWEALCLVLI